MLAHPTCCSVCIECSCHNKQYKMHKVHCRPCTFFWRVKCERLMFKMISRARKIGQSLGGLIRILHHHYLSVWWLEVYDDFQKQNRCILQSNHISLTLSHTKYQMTNGWFMTMSLSWSKTSTPWTSKRSLSHLSAPQYDQGVTYALCTVHCNVHCALVHWSMIRGWHMHCRVWKVAPRLRPP